MKNIHLRIDNVKMNGIIRQVVQNLDGPFLDGPLPSAEMRENEYLDSTVA